MLQNNEFARSKNLFGAEAMILAKKILSIWWSKDFVEGKDWELMGKRGRDLLHLICVSYAYMVRGKLML